MIRVYNTRFTNNIGENKHEIHLIVSSTSEDSPLHYDLWCKYEIPLVAWYTIYEESIEDFKNGKLKEKL